MRIGRNGIPIFDDPPRRHWKRCPRCRGVGKLWTQDAFNARVYVTCEDCRGRGDFPAEEVFEFAANCEASMQVAANKGGF